MEATVPVVAASDALWPLAGSAAFARTPLAWRTAFAGRLERLLRRHVIEAWYPRSIDRDIGGFATDFDRRWRESGQDDRMLEYEARSTRTVARLGQAFPNDARWVEYARHGAAYLTDVMEDHIDGGWFWLVGRDGSPHALGTKHAHSAAYAISAMVEVYRLTGDATALDAAQRGFDWLEKTLHDNVNGGYHVWATREGRPILSGSDIPEWVRVDDPLGHLIGFKDLNVHSDLLDTIRLLHAERPSQVTRARAAELLELVQHRFARPDGTLEYLISPDLIRVEAPLHSGYALYCAHRCLHLAPAADLSVVDVLPFAQRALAATMDSAWDGRGVRELVGDVKPPRWPWWVQLEAVHAMILLDLISGSAVYRERLDTLMSTIENDLADARYGGLYELPRAQWTLRMRLRPDLPIKAYRWKDPSHEADTCISGIRMLRGLSDRAPLPA